MLDEVWTGTALRERIADARVRADKEYAGPWIDAVEQVLDLVADLHPMQPLDAVNMPAGDFQDALDGLTSKSHAD